MFFLLLIKQLTAVYQNKRVDSAFGNHSHRNLFFAFHLGGDILQEGILIGRPKRGGAGQDYRPHQRCRRRRHPAMTAAMGAISMCPTIRGAMIPWKVAVREKKKKNLLSELFDF